MWIKNIGNNNSEFEIENGALKLYKGNSEHVVIPNSVTIIEYTAFSYCNNNHSIKSIVIPNSVTRIGSGAFTNCCSLTSIHIPASVTEIAPRAFQGCFSLNGITVDEDNKAYKSINGHLYSKDGKILKRFVNAKGEKVVDIPNFVTTIEEGAFDGYGNYNLRRINIPSSVTNVKAGAFYCLLESIIVDEMNNAYQTIDGNLYSKDGKTLIRYATGKNEQSFTVPNSVDSIDDYAFHGHILTEIIIPDSVTHIGWDVFRGAISSNREITTIIAPESLKNNFHLSEEALPKDIKVIFNKSNTDFYPNVIEDSAMEVCDDNSASYDNKSIFDNNNERLSVENTKYIFISYKSEEQNHAAAIKRLLEENNINTWMAPYDIPAGSEYGAVINKAIRNSAGMVLLLSQLAQTSMHIVREMDLAYNAGKTIIPIHIDDSQLTDSFEYRLLTTQIVAVKTIDDSDVEIQKLLEIIRVLVR